MQKHLRSFLFSSIFITSIASASEKENPSSPAPKVERYKAMEALAKGLFYLEDLYVEPKKVSYEDMVFHALKGIVDRLDPHTVVMPRKAFDQLTIDTQGKFGGIGIIVSTEQNRLIVVSPIDDTPAAKAGIQSGDEIIAIDGTKLSDMTGNQSTEKMRGKPNTEITLTIKRKDEPKLLDFTMKREIIKVRSVRGQMLTRGILYARISSFQDNTAKELKEHIVKNAKNIKGLILDLRDNPGGLLDQAVQVSDLFIESGLIVSTVGRTNENVEREFAHKRGTYKDFPIVTLINGGSASASEIVAGALQDHERSLVMGTTSFGKGSVQTLISLPDRSGLKITVARYYTPKDRSIQALGIKPDIVVTTTTPKEEKKRKEADLKGHIDSEDLSRLAESGGIVSELQKWPGSFAKDRQVKTAYTYLRGWAKSGGNKNRAENKL